MLRDLFAAVALVAAVVSPCAAADVETFGGLGLIFPRLDTVYDASYTPGRVVGIGQLFGEPDPRSAARQLLTLESERGAGVAFGVNVYPTSRFGVQVLFDRARLDVTGSNPPQEVSLTYDTIAFPSTDRVERTLTYTFDQRDTEGRLDELGLSFNLAARFGAGRAVGGSLSGGLTYVRFDVEAEPLAAHAAWLGGHAVVFSELYEMTYRTRPEDSFGFNLGGQLDVALGRHVALVVDGRWVFAPKTEAAVRLEALQSTNVVAVPLSRIESFLDLPPFEIDPSYVRLLLGLKWRL